MAKPINPAAVQAEIEAFEVAIAARKAILAAQAPPPTEQPEPEAQPEPVPESETEVVVSDVPTHRHRLRPGLGSMTALRRAGVY